MSTQSAAGDKSGASRAESPFARAFAGTFAWFNLARRSPGEQIDKLDLSPLWQLGLRRPGSFPKHGVVSLRLCIGAAFVLLIAFVGFVLITYSYERNKKLALTTASELFDHITQQTASSVGLLHAQVETLVDLTAQLAPDDGELLLGQERMLNFFAEALRNNPQIESVYLGHSDGDFFLVRAVFGDATASSNLAAPGATAFIVQRVNRNDVDSVSYNTLYFNNKLQQIGREDNFVTGFDPRSREWYRLASKAEGTITTGFYPFFTTGKIGSTVARQFAGGSVVVGADVTLEDVSANLHKQLLTPSTEIVVFTEDGTLLGYDDPGWVGKLTHLNAEVVALRKPHISDLGRPALNEMFRHFGEGTRKTRLFFRADGTDWIGSIKPVAYGPYQQSRVYMAILVPQHELLKNLAGVSARSVLMSLVALVIALLLAWWMAKTITRSAAALANEADEIRQLKLDTPITVRSRIVEIDSLASSMAVMKTAVKRFTTIARSMLAERSSGELAEVILGEIRQACNARSCALLLLSDDGQRLDTVYEQIADENDEWGTMVSRPAQGSLSVRDADGQLRYRQAEVFSVMTGSTVVFDNFAVDERFDVAEPATAKLLVSLKSSDGVSIGLLRIGEPGATASNPAGRFSPELIDIVETLASIATIALENQRLIKSHHDTLESLIKIMAVAIDTKSPHTGGHCQRVPVLTELLAEAAGDSIRPAFKDFKLTDVVRRELHVASWLHDCGKVTTPEHVAEKATKLETVHNRIHEIRTRFEVLWRDAEIAYYKMLAQSDSADEPVARQLLADTQAKLQDDFEFIAACNIGTESMTSECMDRVRSIGAATWERHLDDTLGLSGDERARRLNSDVKLTPREYLLADRPEHLVSRADVSTLWGDNLHQFQMDVPEHEYNLGELHNLTVERGTLTPEERFKINDHIVQTLVMLKSVPFPRELQRVPDIAGNHHEKLDGTGFPRRLTAKELGIEDRIMAIADIFEALTAADRPYKTAKTLSESLRLMSVMRDNGHICPDLFDLFLRKKVYAPYVADFLQDWQDDSSDFSCYLRSTNMAVEHDVS